jgi:DNA recombination protein RmuC
MQVLVILLAAVAAIAATAVLFMLLGQRSRTLEAQGRAEKAVREEAARNREELANSLQRNAEALSSRIDKVCDQVMTLTRMNDERFERIRASVEDKLRIIQADNSRQLEHIRATVDEKLHDTLDKRLGESFRHVSERLEMVHKGLGEMQSLASGVGDLKKVLMNVKTRGILGEVQLSALLEQVLTPEQYARNVATKKGSADRVEFAIRLPECLLPIDAKFPQEDYQRLLEAHERADAAAAEEASKQLVARIRLEAKAIREKYLDPPNTTDFGILFVPTEGLYAEILRVPGLHDSLYRDYQVQVAGPTTLGALLSSLLMGFRTLAIEKRSGEVWSLLGAVKSEFGKFGVILEKTHKKLEEATNTIEDAARKTRTIEKKLKSVEKMPEIEAREVLRLAETAEAENDLSESRPLGD